MKTRVAMISAMVMTIFSVMFFLKQEQADLASATFPIEMNDETTSDEASDAIAHENFSVVKAETKTEAAEIAANSRDAKVVAKLHRFLEKTHDITAQTVREERENLEYGLALALAQETEMPELVEDSDSNGNLWEEHRYRDGMVRYFPK